MAGHLTIQYTCVPAIIAPSSAAVFSFMSFFAHRFFAVNISVVYAYHSFYQRVDAEEYGGTWELIKEGIMGSFALFLVRDLSYLYHSL